MSNFRKNSGRYLIKTPSGYEFFEGVQKKNVDSMYTFYLQDKTFLKCSGGHRLETNVGFLTARNINKDHILSGKKITNIIKEVGSFVVYDPVGVVKHSTYYSNDILSHNTEFIGSSATLVSGAKLRTMAFFNPVLSEDYFDMYVQPVKNHLYICTVDCSEGVGQDYSTINVIDVTEVPYRQVAKFRDNKMPLLFFPNTIYSIATKYNEAFVLVETNNIGQQIIDILHYDLEYENIYKLEQHMIKGQTISSGFKRSSTIGIKTTKTVKKIGCANLKTLIENDKLIINDFDTIAELNTFVRVRDSYEAESGNNDDLVMGLVLFGWLSSQSYFKDATSIDIRTVLMEEQNLLIEENLVPVGFLDNGLEEDIFIEGDDVWMGTYYISNL